MKRIWFILAMLAVCGCTKEKQEESAPHVLVMYMAGYNNLAGDIATNIELELTKGDLPEKGSSNRIVIFAHCAPYLREGNRYKATKQYNVPTAPVLIQAYRENGRAVLDTIATYASDFDETDPGNLRYVLEDIAQRFPAQKYGLLYSSHGTGWLPADDTLTTRAIGGRYYRDQRTVNETDIRDLARALPMHFDYIVMDACYMGAVEVVYELRHCCDRMVVSETEIPSAGIDYARLPGRVFLGQDPDLEQVCRDYMAHSGNGGTIALIDCSGLDRLAAAVAAIDISGVDPDEVQKMSYSSDYRYFFDLRSICGAKVDEALAGVVRYQDHTAYFRGMQTLKIDECCGLSMYLPQPQDSLITKYYRTLEWGKAISRN